MPKQANTQVSSDVVVQVVPAPKAEYVLQVSDAQHLDTAVELFSEGEDDIVEGQAKLTRSAVILGKVLMPVAGIQPSYAQFGVVRQTWIRKLMAFDPAKSEGASQKAWERAFNSAKRELPELERPKAKTDGAEKMSAKRKAEKEMLSKLDDTQLVELYAAYKSQDNLDKAKIVKREMKERNSAEEDKLNVERKALRETIRKQIAQTTDMDLLRQVSAMLPKLVEKAE